MAAAAAAAAGAGPAVGGKRKKPTYKGSEEEFDYNCDVLHNLYQEMDLERKGAGSNSFSSLSSTNTTGAGTPASKKLADEKRAAAAAAAGVVVKAPVPGEGGRYLAAFRRIGSESKLVLSATDGDSVWHAVLTYREFTEHRARLDLGDGTGWKDLFAYLKSAFEHRGKLHIELSNWAAPTLSVSYTLADGIELIGRFALRQVTDAKLKTAETQAILFALLERAKINALAQHTADELRKAKGEIQTLYNRISGLQGDLLAAHAENQKLKDNAQYAAAAAAASQALDGDGSGGGGGGATYSASQAAALLGGMPPPAAVPAKKNNMSVANPRLKRRKKQRGVKIGDDEAAAAADGDA